jgi:hypothetical protein
MSLYFLIIPHVILLLDLPDMFLINVEIDIITVMFAKFIFQIIIVETEMIIQENTYNFAQNI